MFTSTNKHMLWCAALTGLLALQPAVAATKAAPASKDSTGQTVREFAPMAEALSANLTALNTRLKTASPNDKDMLKLIIGQVSAVDATVDGVLALGLVAAEMRDGSDLATAKKYLGQRCNALKFQTDATASYVGGLAGSIALPATIADVTKTKDLLTQIGQASLCAGFARK